MKARTSSILLYAAILFSFFSCKKQNGLASDSPTGIFETFWKDFNQNYPGFTINNVNWDSLHTVYQASITASTSQAQLFNVIRSCIATLKDAHSDLNAGLLGGYSFYDSLIRQKPANFLGWAVVANYVQMIESNNSNLGFGKVTDSIGYFAITSFEGNANDFLMIDSFISTFKNGKGVIIDVRQNGGGDEANAQIIASRFTTESVIYRYAKFRNGPRYTDLSDFEGLLLDPDGKTKFTKPVILLTNRETFSAAEDFTLMMRSLPNVTQIGDTTFGGVITHPSSKTLANGWTYRIATAINYDHNKNAIINGIAPQVAVTISAADSANGTDRILEAAINKLQ